MLPPQHFIRPLTIHLSTQQQNWLEINFQHVQSPTKDAIPPKPNTWQHHVYLTNVFPLQEKKSFPISSLSFQSFRRKDFLFLQRTNCYITKLIPSSFSINPA